MTLKDEMRDLLCEPMVERTHNHMTAVIQAAIAEIERLETVEIELRRRMRRRMRKALT